MNRTLELDAILRQTVAELHRGILLAAATGDLAVLEACELLVRAQDAILTETRLEAAPTTWPTSGCERREREAASQARFNDRCSVGWLSSSWFP